MHDLKTPIRDDHLEVLFDTCSFALEKYKEDNTLHIKKLTDDILSEQISIAAAPNKHSHDDFKKLVIHRNKLLGKFYAQKQKICGQNSLWNTSDHLTKYGAFGNILINFLQESVTQSAISSRRCSTGVKISAYLTTLQGIHPNFSTIAKNIDATKPLKGDCLDEQDAYNTAIQRSRQA